MPNQLIRRTGIWPNSYGKLACGKSVYGKRSHSQSYIFWHSEFKDYIIFWTGLNLQPSDPQPRKPPSTLHFRRQELHVTGSTLFRLLERTRFICMESQGYCLISFLQMPTLFAVFIFSYSRQRKLCAQYNQGI